MMRRPIFAVLDVHQVVLSDLDTPLFLLSVCPHLDLLNVYIYISLNGKYEGRQY